MDTFYKWEKPREALSLDPRTKLLLLVTISTLMLSSGNDGIFLFIKPVLAFIPFLLLFAEKRYKTGLKYLFFYSLGFFIEKWALGINMGTIQFIIIASCAMMTKFAPSIMMGAILISDTSVSEFIAAMERMHISNKITIPLAVVFRFFPALIEEYNAISDAMKMRGIRFGRGSLISILEYRLVPLMMCTMRIGDEISSAALTRGLGSTDKRTNLCNIAIRLQDIIIICICLVSIVLYFLHILIPF